MTQEEPLDRSWSMTLTGGPPSVLPQFHPLAEEWRDIAERERANGIGAGWPILTSGALVDYRVNEYFRSAFRADQSSTARTYAVEIRTWFNFLASRPDADWEDATDRDLRAFQEWRVYDETNPRRISPATWNKGWEALNHFYSWATHQAMIESNPVRDARRLTDPRSPRAHREKNARYSRHRWLTPDEYALWRDVGLRGYSAEHDQSGAFRAGVHSPSARSRNTSRNAAFVDYGLTTGLRRAEQGTLLSIELPTAVDEEIPIIGKGSVLRHYRVVHPLGLESMDNYLRGERRDAVRRGRKAGRYDATPDRVIVEVLNGRSGQKVRLGDGRILDVLNLTEVERRRLLVEETHGIEPAWLWLNEAGEPISPASWTDVFKAANVRLTAVRRMHGIRSPRVTVTPHSLRFTFALFVLLAAVRAIDEELSLGPADAFHVRNYSQAFDMVRDLLGHSSSETTRTHYLEPVQGLRAATSLRGHSLSEMWEGLRKTSPSVGFEG